MNTPVMEGHVSFAENKAEFLLSDIKMESIQKWKANGYDDE